MGFFRIFFHTISMLCPQYNYLNRINVSESDLKYNLIMGGHSPRFPASPLDLSFYGFWITYYSEMLSIKL